MEGVLMFILGGFVSAIIFYPKKVDKAYLAGIIANNFYYGVYIGQTRNDYPPLKLEEVSHLAIAHIPLYLATAKMVSKRLLK
jgi:hypothetical protein